jgi:ribose 5-phosphate isomerase A
MNATKNAVALKKLAAEHAVTFIQSGMIIGLGVGSTAIFAIRKVAAKIKSGELKNIIGIPCSKATANEANTLGIHLSTLKEYPEIDLTIDGADEVDPQLNLIKGGGGALLREKIVAQASKREIIVIDESKLSFTLGTNWPLPIEVIPFGWNTQFKFLKSIGGAPQLRYTENNQPYQTDQGNYIIDCHFGPINNPVELSTLLNNRTGIVAHGLFLSLATDLIVGKQEGVEHIKKPKPIPNL